MATPLPPNPTLADLQAYARAESLRRGFDRSEISKTFMMLTEEVGELAHAARRSAGMKSSKKSDAKTEAAHEAADVLFVLLEICTALGIDLEQAFRNKEEINKARTWEKR